MCRRFRARYRGPTNSEWKKLQNTWVKFASWRKMKKYMGSNEPGARKTARRHARDSKKFPSLGKNTPSCNLEGARTPLNTLPNNQIDVFDRRRRVRAKSGGMYFPIRWKIFTGDHVFREKPPRWFCGSQVFSYPCVCHLTEPRSATENSPRGYRGSVARVFRRSQDIRQPRRAAKLGEWELWKRATSPV